jgi:ArsR family transcriptional regulator
MKTVNRVFKAFADETRLRILHLLTKGELCVCDIMAVLKTPQSKVSRHLSYLKRAGLVADRRDGLWRHYSLARPKTVFQKRIIDCIGCCLDEAPILRKDSLRLTASKGKCP